MRHIKTTLIFLAIAAAALSCTKENKPEPDDGTKHLYITASYYNGTNYVCGYWVDGERHMLETGVGKDKNADVYSITKYGKDIYVSGEFNNQACYWKNGKRTIISTKESAALDILVHKGDVVACGARESMAAVWINGKELMLSTEEITIPARMLLDKDGSLYLYGTFLVVGKFQEGRIWKIEHPFTNPVVSKVATPISCENVISMAFNGEDTHTLLYVGKFQTAYFKNKDRYGLAEGMEYKDMYVSEDGVAKFILEDLNTRETFLYDNAKGTSSKFKADGYPNVNAKLITGIGGQCYATGTVGTGGASDAYTTAYWTPDGECHILEPGSDYTGSFSPSCIKIL